MCWCSQGGAEPFCASGDHHGSSTEAQPCPCAQPPAHPSLPPAGAEVPTGLSAGNVWPVFLPAKAARPLPALQALPVCVCRGKGPWVTVAELVRCWMCPSPAAGTSIGIACLYGGCIQRTSLCSFFQGLSPPVPTTNDEWFCVPCPLSSSLQMLPVPFSFCTFSLLYFQAPCPPLFFFLFPCL